MSSIHTFFLLGAIFLQSSFDVLLESSFKRNDDVHHKKTIFYRTSRFFRVQFWKEWRPFKKNLFFIDMRHPRDKKGIVDG